MLRGLIAGLATILIGMGIASLITGCKAHIITDYISLSKEVREAKVGDTILVEATTLDMKLTIYHGEKYTYGTLYIVR